MSEKQITRDLIEGYIEDYIADFLYYDRRDDSVLGRGDIEKAIQDGVITIDQIVEKYREALTKGVKSD